MTNPILEVEYYDLTDAEYAVALVRSIGAGRFHVAAHDGEERVVLFIPPHDFSTRVDDVELLEEARDRDIWIDVPRIRRDIFMNPLSLPDALSDVDAGREPYLRV